MTVCTHTRDPKRSYNDASDIQLMRGYLKEKQQGGCVCVRLRLGVRTQLLKPVDEVEVNVFM